MKLDKNSEHMKTVVETFVIEETAELIYDNDKLDKWNEIVSELGLKGQSEIVKPKKSPIPFMHMNSSLVQVCQELCPRIVPVEEYDKTPIPLEILELVSLSKREEYFSEIQIWYDDKSPDPFCVGLKCEYYSYDSNGNRTINFATREEAKDAAGKSWSVYTQNGAHYLLGKWADVKRSFEELREMAKERYMENESTSLKETIKNAQTRLDELEFVASRRFSK